MESVDFECFRRLDFLNGFLSGISDKQINEYLRLMRLVDFRYSLELEGIPVALSRLMEGLSSQNGRKDALIESSIRYLDWFAEIRSLSLESLSPQFLRSFKKNADQTRERNESVIRSYFTNLSLYTAPQGQQVLSNLRVDLDKVLRNIHLQEDLRSIAAIHFQIRAVAPYNLFNGIVARSYQVLALRLLGLDYDFLPISRVISSRRERYQSLMRESLADNNLESWNIFIAEVLSEAARKVPIQIRKIIRLKGKLREQLLKYTEYNLPEVLTEVLMQKPYVKTSDILDSMDCHRQTAYTYLEHLVRMGVLIEKVSGREKLYFHKELFDVLNE